MTNTGSEPGIFAGAFFNSDQTDWNYLVACMNGDITFDGPVEDS